MSDLYEMLREARSALKTVASLDDRIRLADAIDSVSELQAENESLRRRISDLEAELAAVKRLERADGAYFVLEDDGSRVGPVCPRCYRGERVIIKLERTNGGAHCPCCGTRFPGVRASVDGPRQRASW